MMINLKNISFRYPDSTEALININISVGKGEKLVLAGPNGAGKSTLFLILNGILKPSSGEYLFEGKKIEYSKSELFQLRKTIGIVFQEPDNQIFSSNVYDEIAFGPLNLNLPHPIVRKRVVEAMNAMDINCLKDRPAHLLSFGQKKRVTMASILAMDPEIIIFDEPTSGLDPIHANAIIAMLDKLHQKGKTIIIATHDMNLAYQWSNRIVLLSEGCIAGDGPAAKIFNNPALMRQCQLEQPFILQVYQALKKVGTTTPGNLQELVEQINFQQ